MSIEDDPVIATDFERFNEMQGDATSAFITPEFRLPRVVNYFLYLSHAFHQRGTNAHRSGRSSDQKMELKGFADALTESAATGANLDRLLNSTKHPKTRASPDVQPVLHTKKQASAASHWLRHRKRTFV